MQTIGVTVSAERSFPVELQVLNDRFTLKTIHPGQLESTISGCDILYFWNLAYEELEAAINNSVELPRLIYIARQGEDEWLMDELASTSTHLQYAKGSFSNAIAEYVLASLLMLCKNLHVAAAQQEWKKHDSGWALGSRALILGRGDIAQKTKVLLASVGIKSQLIGRKEVVSIAKLHLSSENKDNIGNINHIICCLSYEKDTQNILGINFFSHFRNANFINISRGKVLNEDEFRLVLDNSFVRAAVLDVFQEEPLSPESTLWEDERVVVSPHQSYKTHDWANRLHQGFIQYANNLVQ